MKYLKRYDPISTAGVQEQPDGQYVKFEDYLKERQSLTHSRDNLMRILDEIAALVHRDQNKETLVGAVRRAIGSNNVIEPHSNP